MFLEMRMDVLASLVVPVKVANRESSNPNPQPVLVSPPRLLNPVPDGLSKSINPLHSRPILR